MYDYIIHIYKYKNGKLTMSEKVYDAKIGMLLKLEWVKILDDIKIRSQKN